MNSTKKSQESSNGFLEDNYDDDFLWLKYLK